MQSFHETLSFGSKLIWHVVHFVEISNKIKNIHMWRGSVLFKRYVLYSICTLWSEAQKISQVNSLSCHKRFRSGGITCERIVNLALASRFKILPLDEVHKMLLLRLTCREHIPLSFAYRILFNLATLSIVLSVFSLKNKLSRAG